MLTDQVARLNTKTDEIVEYLLPRKHQYPARLRGRQWPRPVVWAATIMAAPIIKVEPWTELFERISIALNHIPVSSPGLSRRPRILAVRSKITWVARGTSRPRQSMLGRRLCPAHARRIFTTLATLPRHGIAARDQL